MALRGLTCQINALASITCKERSVLRKAVAQLDHELNEAAKRMDEERQELLDQYTTHLFETRGCELSGVPTPNLFLS